LKSTSDNIQEVLSFTKLKMIMNKELLIKYCNNCCTEAELIFVLEWFQRSAGTPEGKSLLLNIWEAMPVAENENGDRFDLMLDRIHHEVNLIRSKNLLQIADNNLIRYRKRANFIKVLTRVAAILMLPVLCFSLYILNKYQSSQHVQESVNLSYNEIISSVDAITKVTLPDGSNVWLNHSSSLKYPSSFQGDSRTTELKGEGYFEVAHNSKIPFIVKTGDIQIKATGTAFNVMAYPDEGRIETSLIEGRVELELIDREGNITPLIKMKPTDLAIFKKTSYEINTRTISDDRYFSWKEGKLVFNKEPMGEVAKKLGRWFNVDIQIKDPELLDITYTATFVQETLPQVLELMAMASPIKYSISNRVKLSNGTFTRRKIVLSHRKNL
jgi:transmembrane sensor